MPSYNRVILIGRLTKDPELKYTAGGLAVTKFSIAVDRKFKNQQGERQTDFFDCTAWRQKAEFVANYVSKGRMVAVEGSIEFNDATGQDGQKRRYTNIVCDNVETLDAPRDADGNAPQGGGSQGSYGGQQSGGQGGSQGGNQGGAPRNNAPAEDDGGGYFADEEPAAAPIRNANARPQGAPSGGQTAQGGQSGGGQANRGAASGGNRPAATPAAAYPEDDFDDSDPFADQ